MSTYYSLHVVERLKELETKTGYSKVYFFLVAVVLLSLLIVFAGGIKLVTDLLGFLYPAYMSFKSMESSSEPDSSSDEVKSESRVFLGWMKFLFSGRSLPLEPNFTLSVNSS